MPLGVAIRRGLFIDRSKFKGSFHTLRACLPVWKAKGERKGARDTSVPLPIWEESQRPQETPDVTTDCWIPNLLLP